MSSKKFQHKKTSQVVTATYASTKGGNLRYHIDGKPVSDKKLEKDYDIVLENTSQLTGKTAFLNGEEGLHEIDQDCYDLMKLRGQDVTILDKPFRQTGCS